MHQSFLRRGASLLVTCSLATLTVGARQQQLTPAIAPTTPAATPDKSATFTSSSSMNAYSVSFAKSERKWRFGFRSEPFNKVSQYFEDQLTNSLNLKGFRRVPVQSEASCQISLELLEVTTHPAAFKKPGMDVSANVTVIDASSRIVFSRGFRGESRTFMNTYGHLINHAVEDLVRNVTADERFLNSLPGLTPRTESVSSRAADR